MEEEQLRLAANEAADAVKKAERACREECEESRVAIRAKHADKIAGLMEAESAAMERLNDHIEANASHPWEGKKVYANMYASAWSTAMKYQYGIVEIARKDTVFATNAGAWSKPSIGQVFIRKIKKDGTPAIQIADANPSFVRGWKLVDEGQTP